MKNMDNKDFQRATGLCVRIIGKAKADKIKDELVEEAKKRAGSKEEKLSWLMRELLKELRRESILFLNDLGEKPSVIADKIGVRESTVRWLLKAKMIEK